MVTLEGHFGFFVIFVSLNPFFPMIKVNGSNEVKLRVEKALGVKAY